MDFKQAFDSIWHDGMWRDAKCTNTRANDQTCTRDISKNIKCHKSLIKDHRIFSHENRGTTRMCRITIILSLILGVVMALSLSSTEAGIKLNGKMVNNLSFADIGHHAGSGTE